MGRRCLYAQQFKQQCGRRNRKYKEPLKANHKIYLDPIILKCGYDLKFLLKVQFEANLQIFGLTYFCLYFFIYTEQNHFKPVCYYSSRTVQSKQADQL